MKSSRDTGLAFSEGFGIFVVSAKSILEILTDYTTVLKMFLVHMRN